MTTAVVRCPKCKTQYKVKNAAAMEGKKILCKKCQAPIRIPEAVSASKKESQEDEFGTQAPFDDEFAGMDMAAQAPLPARRIKKKQGTLHKPSAAGVKKESGDGNAATTEGSKSTAILLIVVAVGVLGLAGIGVAGVFFFRSAGSAKYVAPSDKQYVDFNPKDCGLSCRIPKNWTQNWGGGMGGQPYWVRVGDDRFKIEARESIGGGAMAQSAIAMQQRVDPGGQDESLSPAAQVHKAQEHDFAENFEGYHEEPAVKIKTNFGEGRIADFTAKEGIFKSNITGCRATLLNNLHEFNVSFKCSPAMFKDARPVFEKVVASMGPGSAP